MSLGIQLSSTLEERRSSCAVQAIVKVSSVNGTSCAVADPGQQQFALGAEIKESGLQESNSNEDDGKCESNTAKFCQFSSFLRRLCPNLTSLCGETELKTHLSGKKGLLTLLVQTVVTAKLLG